MYLDRAWLGLRFLRAVILYNLPDVLVYIRVINSSQAIRVVQLMCTFICIVSLPRGRSHRTSAKIYAFWTPSSSCHCPTHATYQYYCLLSQPPPPS